MLSAISKSLKGIQKFCNYAGTLQIQFNTPNFLRPLTKILWEIYSSREVPNWANGICFCHFWASGERNRIKLMVFKLKFRAFPLGSRSSPTLDHVTMSFKWNFPAINHHHWRQFRNLSVREQKAFLMTEHLKPFFVDIAARWQSEGWLALVSNVTGRQEEAFINISGVHWLKFYDTYTQELKGF